MTKETKNCNGFFIPLYILESLPLLEAEETMEGFARYVDYVRSGDLPDYNDFSSKTAIYVFYLLIGHCTPGEE